MTNTIPYALDIEKAYLGAILTDPQAKYKAPVDPEAFYEMKHRQIYSAMLMVESPDVPSLKAYFDQQNIDIPASYLVGLTIEVASSSKIKQHAEILQEYHLRRKLLAGFEQWTEKVYSEDLQLLITEIKHTLLQTKVGNNYESLTNPDLIESWYADYDKPPKFIKTGLYTVDSAIGGFTPTDFGLILADTNVGKCLGKGTPVLMYDGSIKKVEDIVVGDQIMGPDSKPRNVLSLASGRQKMYKITQKYGEPYIVNSSHILSLRWSKLTKQGDGKGAKYLRWKEYQEGGIVNINVEEYQKKSKLWKKFCKGWKAGSIEFTHARKKWTISPYILGVWLGDGYSAGARIWTGDSEIEREVNIFAKVEGLKVRSIRESGCNRLNISGDTKEPFLVRLREEKLLKNKHIPLKYKTASKQDRMELLAGLIDTDGNVSPTSWKGKKCYAYEYCGQNKTLVDDVAFVARSLGYKVSLRSKIAHSQNGTESVAYIARISGSVWEIPVRVERKKISQENGQKKQNIVFSSIEKVEDIGEDEYFGFTIDGDHLFLLGDFTVTHNTTMLLNMAVQMALAGKHVLFFSLEMTASQLNDKFIAIYGKHNAQAIRNRVIPKSELESSVSDFSALPITVIHKGAITSQDVVSEAYNRRLSGQVDIVMVDYVQRLSDHSKESETIKMKTIAQNLKNFALTNEIPVITPAQVDKASSQGGKIKVENVAWAKALADEADTALYLYEVEKSKGGGMLGSNFQLEKELRCRVVKSRHSEKGQDFVIDFDRITLRMEDTLGELSAKFN